MRIMMKIKIPVEKGNQAFADGSMQKAFEQLMERLKPEASYFYMEDGLRAATLICNVDEEYRFFEAHEPMFAALNALIDETPVLTWEDMATGFKDMTG
ncbi:MAG: hypothetical protein V3V97_08990 [Hyphomicrobiaceae bacterium]